MEWRKFFVWNAAGGIVWATAVGLVAYYFGRAVADAIEHYGLIGAAVAIGIAVFVLVGFHLWKKRRWEAEEEARLKLLRRARGGARAARRAGLGLDERCPAVLARGRDRVREQGVRRT